MKERFIVSFNCSNRSDSYGEDNVSLNAVVTRKWLLRLGINPDVQCQRIEDWTGDLFWDCFDISLVPVDESGKVSLNDLAKALCFESPKTVRRLLRAECWFGQDPDGPDSD